MSVLTVEIKRCPNLIICDDCILWEKSLPLPGASQAFLCRELTGVLLEPNICASHSSVSLLHETLNPDNQPKHIQAFILKIPAAKTQGVLTVHKVWNWRLGMCLTNAARKNNTHLRSGEIQGHSWCDEALWFFSELNNSKIWNMTSTVPPLAWAVPFVHVQNDKNIISLCYNFISLPSLLSVDGKKMSKQNHSSLCFKAWLTDQVKSNLQNE